MTRLACLAAFALYVLGFALLVRNVMDPYWRDSTDFGLYLHAAKQLMAGSDPYAPIAARDDLFFGQPNGDGYIYPPVLAWLIAVFLPFGDGLVRALWISCSFAALCGSVWVLLRGFGNRVPVVAVVGLIGAMLLTRFFRMDLYHGQANPLLLLALVLGIKAMHEDKPLRAAAWWALPIMVKPFCGVLALYLAWRRQWRASALCLALGVGAIVLSFIPVLVRSPEALDSFAAMAHYYAASDLAGGRPDNISMHGLAIRLFEANRYTVPFINSHRVTVALEALTVLVLAAPFLMRWTDGARKPSSAELLVQVTMAMAVPLVWGPMTNGSHLMLLLPGLVGVWMLARTDKRWRSVAAIWSALFLFRMAPVRLESRWFGSLFGGPADSTWETATGFWTLWTAQGTLVLLVAVLLMGTATVMTERADD